MPCPHQRKWRKGGCGALFLGPARQQGEILFVFRNISTLLHFFFSCPPMHGL